MSLSRSALQRLDQEWKSATPDAYAKYLQHCEGADIRKVAKEWFYRARPFFYRPVLPFRSCDSLEVAAGFAPLSVFQCAVRLGAPSNSYLNIIFYDDIGDYHISKLPKSIRHDLRNALTGDLRIAPILEPGQHCREGYESYLSFFRRTRYKHISRRREWEQFVRWWQSMFDLPELNVWGGFRNNRLISFEITCLVEDTLMITTRIHSDEALRFHMPDLMLHAWRISARESGQVSRVCDSLLVDSPGINNFKLRRGAKVIAQPAYLRVSPLLLSGLRRLNPKLHARLVGLKPEEILQASSAVPPRSNAKFLQRECGGSATSKDVTVTPPSTPA